MWCKNKVENNKLFDAYKNLLRIIRNVILMLCLYTNEEYEVANKKRIYRFYLKEIEVPNG